MTHDAAHGPAREPGDIRPRLRLPWPGPPPWLVAGVLCLLGVGVLFAVEARHHSPAPARATTETAGRFALPETPELEIPPPPPPAPPPQPQVVYVQRPAPPPIIQYVDRPQPPRAMPSETSGAKLAEPVLPIDLAEAAQAPAQTGEDAPAEAVVLHNRSTLVPQGSMIPAVIESPINTDNPGPVRAVTTGDTRGFDGTRILIPRGSRLVGDLHGGAGVSLNRASIVWTRLVRPDGVAIRFSAPATDPRGGVGVPGNVNNHILARISSAVLQSALTVGVLLASEQNNASVIVGAPIGNAGAVAQAVLPPVPATPTITIKAGAPIMIFVTRDLDFAGVSPKR